MWNHFTPTLLAGADTFIGRMGFRLLNAGWAGVDLFFVLSGFLITGILLDAKQSGVRPRQYFISFYARRTLRIFPLYYAVLIGISIFALFAADPGFRAGWTARSGWLWAYASNILTAQQGWSFRFGDLLLNHFWSLAVEEQFYLVWPLVVFFCGRRSLRAGCLAMLALAPLLRGYLVAIENNGFAFVLMPCRIDAFAVGALAAMAFRSSTDCRKAGVRLTIAAALLLPASFASDLLLATAGRSILAVGAAGLILLATQSRAAALLNLSPLRFFGKYSYGLYVWHFLLFHTLDRLFPLESLGVIGRFAGCVALSCIIAWCSWHLLEKHFMKLKRLFPMSPDVASAARADQPPAAGAVAVAG